MKAYKYHPTTKEFTGEVDCQIDPRASNRLKKEVYLIPGGASTNKPPLVKENEVAILEDSKWKIKKNFRKDTYYDKATKKEKRITTID